MWQSRRQSWKQQRGFQANHLYSIHLFGVVGFFFFSWCDKDLPWIFSDTLEQSRVDSRGTRKGDWSKSFGFPLRWRVGQHQHPCGPLQLPSGMGKGNSALGRVWRQRQKETKAEERRTIFSFLHWTLCLLFLPDAPLLPFHNSVMYLAKFTNLKSE